MRLGLAALLTLALLASCAARPSARGRSQSGVWCPWRQRCPPIALAQQCLPADDGQPAPALFDQPTGPGIVREFLRCARIPPAFWRCELRLLRATARLDYYRIGKGTLRCVAAATGWHGPLPPPIAPT